MLLALVVAVAVQVVGVLLIFALLVTPAAIAQQLSSRPSVALVIAVALGLLFTWLGLAIGYFTPYPVGFYITTFAFATYVVVRGGYYLPHPVWTTRGERGETRPEGRRMIVAELPPLTINLWQDMQNMLQYDFMRQALLAGTILSAVAGLIGYFVVLRHQAFAGEALSDVAFTGALSGPGATV